jgi:hypothetical protein
MYVLEREEGVEGGNVQFQRAFFRQEANYIFSTIDNVCPREAECIIKDGLMPLRQVKILRGRLLVYPNCHIHKLTKIKNAGDTRKIQRLRILVFT